MKGIFRNDRVKELQNNRTPVKFLSGAKIVLHLMADSRSTIDPNYNIEIIERNPNYLLPIKSLGMETSHTFDGFLTYTTELDGSARSYAHLYRKGVIEAVEGSLVKAVVSKKEIPSIAFEEEILKTLPYYFEVLRRIDVQSPITIYLSFVNIKDYSMKLNQEILGVQPIQYPDENLKLSDIFIENFNNIDNVPRMMQPVFDEVWNAFGMFKSFNYDEDGNWGYGLNMKD
ncbi:MAG: hypothetical protein KGD64_06735 [Candidatus Heimdallarchaeota archaeon]|nr:hypothetical protein [Candidatus Heimdallarchaeota archaeon]